MKKIITTCVMLFISQSILATDRVYEDCEAKVYELNLMPSIEYKTKVRKDYFDMFFDQSENPRSNKKLTDSSLACFTRNLKKAKEGLGTKNKQGDSFFEYGIIQLRHFDDEESAKHWIIQALKAFSESPVNSIYLDDPNYSKYSYNAFYFSFYKFQRDKEFTNKLINYIKNKDEFIYLLTWLPYRYENLSDKIAIMEKIVERYPEYIDENSLEIELLKFYKYVNNNETHKILLTYKNFFEKLQPTLSYGDHKYDSRFFAQINYYLNKQKINKAKKLYNNILALDYYYDSFNSSINFITSYSKLISHLIKNKKADLAYILARDRISLDNKIFNFLDKKLSKEQKSQLEAFSMEYVEKELKQDVIDELDKLIEIYRNK